MRVADLAVIGILAGGVGVGSLFLLAKSEVQRTDWAAMPVEDAFSTLCAVCHGSDGTAPTGAANTLKGKRQFWDVPRLVEYMGDPAGYARAKSKGRLGLRYMQPIPAHVPLETRERLAQYVLERLMD